MPGTMVEHRRKLGVLWRELAAAPGGGRFSPDMVADLPPVARRLVLHAIAPGTPLPGWACLTMTGRMRAKPGGGWLPLRARQIVAPQGFVWRAVVGRWPLQLRGGDFCAGAEGGMAFGWWGWVPLLAAQGPDVSRAAAGRLAMESFWLPTVLLPAAGARWEDVDDAATRLTRRLGAHDHTVTYTVQENGRILSARMDRWGDSGKTGTFSPVPFGGNLAREATFGGVTLPAEVQAGWRPGGPDAFLFFEAVIGKVVWGPGIA